MKLSRNVLALGIVSFFTDVSSEVTVRAIPFFLMNVLGLGEEFVGYIEGAAQSVVVFFRLVSGILSDRMGRRKPLTLAGYGLSHAVKPLLYLVTSWPGVLAIRFLDRMGKGVRTAPRDALIAESSPESDRGRAFGFHRAMDTVGSVLGLLIVIGVARWKLGDANHLDDPTFRILALISCVPAALSMGVLAGFVRETTAISRTGPPTPALPPLRGGRGFSPGLWRYLAAVFVFNLSMVSDAFYVVRAQELGLPLWQVFGLVLIMSVVQASVSVPAGILSDRLGRRGLVALGWVVSGLQLLGFGFATTGLELSGLFVLVGLFLGLTEGNEKALLTDLAPAELKGTAFGFYNLALGVALLVANVALGELWHRMGPRVAFSTGAVTAVLGASLLAFVPPPRRAPAPSA
ncbi:MAG TPA: MFS transporter [Planctomycetota bacterium]|nr:MFS transporter [Planctomycetota bacterium]